MSGPAGGPLRWSADPVTVRVPATSANLGPGFDAFGLALTLHDVVEARVVGHGLIIEVSGTGHQTADAGEDHLVIRAMRAGFEVLGGQPPGLAIRCVNAIPQGFGLGSSAGAIVAGLLAARALAGHAGPAGQAGSAGQVRTAGQTGTAGQAGAGGQARADCRTGGPDRAGGCGLLPDAAVLQIASRLEGHPDNVAACLAGGLTIAWQPDGTARFARLTPLADLAPVICVPAEPLATASARQVLPGKVPHADAAANSARAALLVAALTEQPGLLMDATQDYLHQGYRAAAMPQTTSLVGRLRAAGIPAVVSGAGPAVLALTLRGAGPGAREVAAIAGQAGAPWQLLPLGVDRHGAAVQDA
jgi:homoserine kinase